MNPILWIVASSIGSVVLVVLALIYRRAAASRELELAEELLDAEYRNLTSASPRSPSASSRGGTS